MPNMHSKAGHTPERTCVVCRTKRAQAELLPFLLIPEGIVFDLEHKLMQRKYYLCHSSECFVKLAKWRRRYEKNRKKDAA